MSQRCPTCGGPAEFCIHPCHRQPASEPSRLADMLSREDHACSTGDCGHTLQRECDETLARDYPPAQAAEPEEWELGHNGAKLVAKSAYDALKQRMFKRVTADAAEIERLRRELKEARAHIEMLQKANREQVMNNESFAAGEMAADLDAARSEVDRLRKANTMLAQAYDLLAGKDGG